MLLPPIEWGQYILGYLFEMGPTMPGAMGAGPLTFSEIEAWQRVVAIDLQPFEAQLIRRLSVEYFGQSHASTKRDCPAPYGGDVRSKTSTKKELDRKMRQFLG